MSENEKIKVAVLGSGGLGMSAVSMIEQKEELNLVAIADKFGAAINLDGLDSADLHSVRNEKKSVGESADGIMTDDAIGEIIKNCDGIDGIFIALPNIPNSFVPGVVSRFAKANYGGVMVDALKRTGAVELILGMNEEIAASKMTYFTGAGATPGLLTAAAALASQSFMEIMDVNIDFGVGISNWESYRATIREDIAHLEGFDLDKVSKMTCAQIKEELNNRNGILELVNMEHADDILLEHAGVTSRENVRVGGVVDTRNPKKPVSTTVTVTGRTFDGFTSSHKFVLGDETTMGANVVGPSLGWMKASIELNRRGIHGVFTSAELMPKFVK